MQHLQAKKATTKNHNRRGVENPKCGVSIGHGTSTIQALFQGPGNSQEDGQKDCQSRGQGGLLSSGHGEDLHPWALNSKAAYTKPAAAHTSWHSSTGQAGKGSPGPTPTSTGWQATGNAQLLREKSVFFTDKPRDRLSMPKWPVMHPSAYGQH